MLNKAFFLSCIFIWIGTLIFHGCKVSSKARDGIQAFELKRYATAIEMLKEEIAKTHRKEDRAYKLYLIAKSFEKNTDYESALDYYNQAEKAEYGVKATIDKAYALKKMMRYNEAAVIFSSLTNLASLSNEMKQQSLLCKEFQSRLNNVNQNETVEKLLVESFYSDYSAVNYDDDFLVITSDRDEATGSKKYEWTQNKYSDLFIVDKESKNVSRFDPIINSEYNDGTPAFTKDFKTMVFTRCFNESLNKDDYCRLMVSKRINGLWIKPQTLSFTNEAQNYGQPCFIANDSVLVFATKAEKSDNYDLLYSEYDGEVFSEPLALPNTINSSANEFFPTADGDTLYFSSDNKLGMGGYDIYKTWLKQDGIWSKPTPLDFPINSGADDFGYVIDKTIPRTKNIDKIAYFTSCRGGDAKDVIYEHITFKKSEDKEKETAEKDQKEGPKVDIYLALKVVTSKNGIDAEKDKKISKINLVNAQVSIWVDGKKLLEGNSDKNGLLLTQIDINKEFEIKVSKDSFLFNALSFNTKNIKIDNDQNTVTINKEIELNRIFKGKEILLENIYYEYDKWDITKTAEPTLLQLVDILKNNPNINIELGSHTDCRGQEDYNLTLSQKRAQSAIDFLILNGIDKNRVSAKGYGETIPTINCVCEQCSEEQHQINRRTSFKIL